MFIRAKLKALHLVPGSIIKVTNETQQGFILMSEGMRVALSYKATMHICVTEVELVYDIETE